MLEWYLPITLVIAAFFIIPIVILTIEWRDARRDELYSLPRRAKSLKNTILLFFAVPLWPAALPAVVIYFIGYWGKQLLDDTKETS